MREVLLVRFGEVHLKGQNRPYFLKTLTENVRRAVKPLGGQVWLADSRIYVAGVEDMRACGERVRRVFGVYSVSPAWELPKEFDVIAAKCVEMMRPLSGSFKVFARRSDKHFPMNSMEIATEIGGRVLEDNANLHVDVHHPEHRLNVEIRDHAYVCVEEWKAVGGMPMSTGGKAALLLSGGIDSPVAGYQLMKRGVTTCAIHFQSPPYTGELALDKVLQLAKILGEYENGMRVYLVPFTKVQTEIHEKCPEGLGTLITRRFMMRIAERLARKFALWRSLPARASGRWPARPWRPSPARTRWSACPCSVRSSAWTNWRSPRSPKRSAPTRPPSCPMRTAALCSPPATPSPSPGSTPCRTPSANWTSRRWSQKPWRTRA